jgi:phosphoribosylformimino-5-aminoimidazole carboxamide ribotide isomerase
LKIIPVIDVLNGLVVHAVRGKRKEYQPLQSTLCKSAEPISVARAFRNLDFSEVYVADLDAISGHLANFQLIKRISDEIQIKLMVDAGFTNIQIAKKMLEDNSASKIIVGTETLEKESFLTESIKTFGSNRVIVSLDLKDGKVLTSLSFDGCFDPMRLLKNFVAIGVSQIIVLDLSRVGSKEGVDVEFLKEMIGNLSIDVYVGGGVRDIQDLIELRKIGVTGVLVATALHQGKILANDLRQVGLL